MIVPETLPQDFVEIADDNGICYQEDSCSMTDAQVDCSVAAVAHDDVIKDKAENTASADNSHLEMLSPASPVFNAAPVPVSSSPSLFDEEEDKHLHQRSKSMKLLILSDRKFAAADATKPSPSVLSGKLGVSELAFSDSGQNKDSMNGQQSVGLSSLPQSTADGLQMVDKVKCNYAVKTKPTSVHNRSELNEQLNDADDMHTFDVDKAGQVASNSDMLDITSPQHGQNDSLAAEVKLSQYATATDTSNMSHVICEFSDFQQPVPKRQRHSADKSSMFLRSLPHAVISNDVDEDCSGKLFSYNFFIN